MGAETVLKPASQGQGSTLLAYFGPQLEILNEGGIGPLALFFFVVLATRIRVVLAGLQLMVATGRQEIIQETADPVGKDRGSDL